jgi:hypothetical protein
MLNFSHSWYDPKGDTEPQEFADMVVDLFQHGFTAPAAKGCPPAGNMPELNVWLKLPEIEKQFLRRIAM